MISHDQRWACYKNVRDVKGENNLQRKFAFHPAALQWYGHGEENNENIFKRLVHSSSNRWFEYQIMIMESRNINPLVPWSSETLHDDRPFRDELIEIIFSWMIERKTSPSFQKFVRNRM